MVMYINILWIICLLIFIISLLLLVRRRRQHRKAMLQANAASNNFLVNHTVVNMPNGAMGGSSLPPYNQPAPYPSGYYPTPPNHSTSQTVYSPPPLPATSHDPELAPPPPSYQDYTKDTRI